MGDGRSTGVYLIPRESVSWAPATCQSPRTVAGGFSPLSSCCDGQANSHFIGENVEVQSLVTPRDHAAKVTE